MRPRGIIAVNDGIPKIAIDRLYATLRSVGSLD
jgi:hypothetical protein